MNGRYIIGFSLVILGILFLIDRLEIIYFGDIISTWWPLFILGVGVYEMARGQKRFVFGLFVFIIGLIFQGQNLEILPGNFWDAFWPLMLVLIGVWILSGKLHHKKDKNKKFSYKDVSFDNTISENETDFQFLAVFGGSRETVEKEDLRNGVATAVFGGVELDLRKCQIPTGEARLELTAAFGGIEIWIPQNWKIETNGLPLFGALSNKTWPLTNEIDIPRPVLKINYLAMFGGIEIKN